MKTRDNTVNIEEIFTQGTKTLASLWWPQSVYYLVPYENKVDEKADITSAKFICSTCSIKVSDGLQTAAQDVGLKTSL